LQIPLQKLHRHAAGFVDIAAPDSELAIDHRRIVEDEELFAAWRSVALHQVELFGGDGFGQLARVGDGGGAAYELRLGMVELADSPQPAQQIRQVTAIDSAVVM
jgi:hypothetical protein